MRRLEAGHVWFWPSDLHQPQDLPGSASPVLLLEPRGKVAASALYDPQSAAPLRVYHRGRCAFDESFALSRWNAALDWRRRIVPSDTDAYRILHSEGDLTPGLIVDRFGSHLSISITSSPWRELVPAILAAAPKEWNIESAVEEFAGQPNVILGTLPEAVGYRMNGLRMFAKPQGGQKTGAFLDQRENYVRLNYWVNSLASREYGLDLYSSNGGFARHLAAGIRKVEAVERGQAAIELLERGLQSDGVNNVQTIRADVQSFLQGKVQARRQYDAVVVDPPAFAKQRRERESALRQYSDINTKALRLVRPGGLFVSCSCSHHVTANDLLDVIRAAATQNEKTLQILEKRTQSSDHPIQLLVPETEYLKCFYFRVI